MPNMRPLSNDVKCREIMEAIDGRWKATKYIVKRLAHSRQLKINSKQTVY